MKFRNHGTSHLIIFLMTLIKEVWMQGQYQGNGPLKVLKFAYPP